MQCLGTGHPRHIPENCQRSPCCQRRRGEEIRVLEDVNYLREWQRAWLLGGRQLAKRRQRWQQPRRKSTTQKFEAAQFNCLSRPSKWIALWESLPTTSTGPSRIEDQSSLLWLLYRIELPKGALRTLARAAHELEAPNSSQCIEQIREPPAPRQTAPKGLEQRRKWWR